MHYYALVEVPDGKAILEDRLAEVLEPYRESDFAEERQDHELWDGWTIGGRYTGRLDGYDPTTDPLNQERCWICAGTGKRDDELGRRSRVENPGYTCNGCDGTGTRTKWPTIWHKHHGDVSKFKDVPESAKPYTLIACGRAVSREVYDGSLPSGERFVDNSAELDRLWSEIGPEATVVVVDLHI